ncbi:30S ribosomal protein S4e [Methanothrix sp.]|uniref:30S ribosomal protein S4e n=1 Tax=Methanothrix sp. TaxID=90426 RepID=UPI002C34B66D|nr:30S ribosomal protein S4e [Methanothrix sp.]HOK58321.1 30S ribosomal protein S4e [Methanothrix sp.]HOL44142.1 30S ribosomal protein S4e [Methanothrix sp.]HPO88476.1 30S ribosomal protein S4e [Methanothrix sp.]
MHKKRVTIPRSWPIPRKTSKWIATPRPGPHSAEESLPLMVVVRDLLKLADNAREVKRILHEGGVLVDGTVRRDTRFPVGLFDVITVPALNKQYRMVKSTKGYFVLVEIQPDKPRKLVRIENKTTLKGNRTQLNLSDGSNIIAEGEFRTGDSLLISLPERSIEDVIKFEVGNLAMVTGGSHTGKTGRIKSVQIVRSSMPNRVTISADDRDIDTIVDYVFMIGRDAPVIELEAGR